MRRAASQRFHGLGAQGWSGGRGEESELECVEGSWEAGIFPVGSVLLVLGTFFFGGGWGEVCKERAGFVHLT